jgi:hypothetical protein
VRFKGAMYPEQVLKVGGRAQKQQVGLNNSCMGRAGCQKSRTHIRDCSYVRSGPRDVAGVENGYCRA